MGEMVDMGLGPADVGLRQVHAQFFDEAGERIDSLEALLLAMDGGACDDGQLNAAFRDAHSIKGGAAAFGFGETTSLTHAMETLLDGLRRRELPPGREIFDALLRGCDALRGLLEQQRGGARAGVDTSALTAQLKALAGHDALAPSFSADGVGPRVLRLTIGPVKDSGAVDGVLDLFRDIGALGSIEAVDGGEPSPSGHRVFKVITRSPEAELTDLFSFHVSPDQVAFSPWRDAEPDRRITGEPPRADAVDRSADEAAQAPAPGRARITPLPANGGTLRVAAHKIDELIRLVGELKATHATLAQQMDRLAPVLPALQPSGITALDCITRQLDESVSSLRMVPMRTVFSRFPRMVRDLGSALGKQLDLQLIGEEAELDRQLSERIIDPLMHLVRNSADHGIEAPRKRVAAGKPAQGCITMSATHHGESILIEVDDDGAGLSRCRILDKARGRGLAVHDSMTDDEVWALIWEPGFSTAETLSEISGRGVGMDVVKRNIVELGGRVTLHSVAGQGTRVSICLPLRPTGSRGGQSDV